MKSLLKRMIVSVIVVLAVVVTVHAQNVPPSAESVLNSALSRAASENKKVFLMFHASWCGWCHAMDKSMNDAGCEQLFKNNYVVCHLVVKESEDKKHLENPGAEEMLAKYHGDKSGIPFWLIFDKSGRLLADSQIRPEGAGLDTPGQNVGCPSEPHEIAHFIKVLKQTSALNDHELAVIQTRFSKQ